ncbi:hypothetical protein LSH36_372g04089 [Paralvinella palmiformis]|uniref:APCDD1 domain-containing protein n=1 Tax=Paralvinella palmiformis TaxID=53620 RepID=A0AAD9JEL8_9ANNE|nr:hypothetical protein LSH36_372g04089 [Paralvinella palmiformis]
MKEHTLIRAAYLCAVLSQITAGDVTDLLKYDRKENTITVERDLQCSHQMSRVYHEDVITPFPPNLVGEWTSVRCEVRPGPQFLLRKYRFYEDSRFSAIQYYYEDSRCKRPMYTLLATGSYFARHPSWILAGATEMDYQLNHVRIMPATDRMARLLTNKVNASCPSYANADWKKAAWHDLFSYIEIPDKDYPEEDAVLLEDKDCLSAISFSMHELQLLRLEIRKRHHAAEKRLLLGDIHTEPSERRSYRPTGFQEPLVYMDQTDNCPVCSALISSDEYHPPRLRTHHHPTKRVHLTGSWVSTECETRPNGVFITRHLTFSDDDRTWQGHYYHFLDGRCRRPQFTAYVRGKYTYVGGSKVIDGAHQIDFQVLESRVKATDPEVVRSLNDPLTGCGSRQWLIDSEQDITAAGGCRALGIRLPHTEYELVRVEKRHHALLLYFGQRPTFGAVFSPWKRPTSFQNPLVKCTDGTAMVAPSYGHRVMAMAKRADGVASQRSWHPALFVVSLSLAISSALIK